MNHKFIFVFLVVVLTGCATYVSEKDDVFGQNIRINEDLVNSDPKVTALISPYKDKLDAEMNEVIAVSDVELIKATPESTMGNWFADMLMTEALLLDSRVSFACQNRGGLRIGSINKGDITKGKIFELMPFDNFLVIMKTDGAVLKEFIDHISQDGGWPISKELKISMQDSVVTSMMLNGKEIQESSTYYYAIPDYIANGGSNANMLINQERENTGIMIRDIAINHLRKEHQKGNRVNASLDGRFTKKGTK